MNISPPARRYKCPAHCHRAHNAGKTTAGMLKEGAIEFEVLQDTADAAVTPQKAGPLRPRPGRRRRGGVAKDEKGDRMAVGLARLIVCWNG
jgi:hypothetical protein